MGKADRVSALVSRVSGLVAGYRRFEGSSQGLREGSLWKERTRRETTSKERLPGEGGSKEFHQEAAGDRIDT